MIEIGRICVKTAGREAGKHCVVVNKLDENFVVVTGPKNVTKVKRRRCNILHLLPLEEKIKIKPDASDEEILNEYQKAGLFSKLGLGIAEPVQIKAGKAEKPKDEAKTKEKKSLKERLKLKKEKDKDISKKSVKVKKK